MYTGLGYRQIWALFKKDLDLHNALNPSRQLDIKKIKDLQEMSNRVGRERAKIAQASGPSSGIQNGRGLPLLSELHAVTNW